MEYYCTPPTTFYFRTAFLAGSCEVCPIIELSSCKDVHAQVSAWQPIRGQSVVSEIERAAESRLDRVPFANALRLGRCFGALL